MPQGNCNSHQSKAFKHHKPDPDDHESQLRNHKWFLSLFKIKSFTNRLVWGGSHFPAFFQTREREWAKVKAEVLLQSRHTGTGAITGRYCDIWLKVTLVGGAGAAERAVWEPLMLGRVGKG